MTIILQHQPGQVCTILLEILHSDGYREDPPSSPLIQQVIFPNLSIDTSFPKSMIRISTGLYYLNFVLPSGGAAVGSYIVDVFWLDPETFTDRQTTYQIVVTAPFGQYSASVG